MPTACDFVRSLLLASVSLSLFAIVGLAQDEANVRSPNQLEPVDFIDNMAAPQNKAAATTSSTAMPAGWLSATFSPDNATVALISTATDDRADAAITLWKVDEPNSVVSIPVASSASSVAFSPDGRKLAIGPASPQAKVVIINVEQREIETRLPGPVARTNAMAWSTDAKQLALASTTDRSIRIWNVPTTKLIKVIEPEASSLLAIAFSESGQLYAAGVPTGDRDGLAIFEFMPDKPAKVLKGHKELVEAASFSAGATRMSSAGWDATIRTWNVVTGEEIGGLKGHKKGIRSFANSPNGKRVVSSNDRELKLWDSEKQELLADLGVENIGARYVTISADGAWIVSITRDGTAHLFDAERRIEKANLEFTPGAMVSKPTVSNIPPASPVEGIPEPEAIQSVAYSRDGKWIALSREDGSVTVRNAIDGKVIHQWEAFSDVAACVTFSPDNKQVAAGSFDKTIKIWNMDSGALQCELVGHTNWVFSIAFSPDGATLASAGYDKVVRLWDLASAKQIATLTGHTAGIRSVVFTTDGQQLISGSADHTAMVWDVKNRQPVSVLKGHTATVRAVACSPDGATIATASEDATIKLWQTTDWTTRTTIAGTEDVMIWCLAFSPAGRTLAAGAFDGTVKLYDPSNGRERKTLRGATDAIAAVAFAPDARELIAGCVDKSLRRWKSESSQNVAAPTKSGDVTVEPNVTMMTNFTLPKPTICSTQQPVLALAFNKDGQSLAVGTGGFRIGGHVQLWEIQTHEKRWQSDESKFGIVAVAFSPDGRRISTGNYGDSFVRQFDAETGKQTKELRGHRGKVMSVAYANNGQFFATASLDRDIKLWDAVTGKELKTFSGHTEFVHSVAFSPDSKTLLSGSSDRTIRLWNVESGKENVQLKGALGVVQQAVFSTDGKLAAAAISDGTARVYEVATGNFLLTLRGHRNKVDSIAFSPNQTLIATGSSDRTLRIWDLSSGRELLNLAQEGAVRAVLFSPDGKYLAAGCDDKTVKLWHVAGIAKSEPTLSAKEQP